MRLWLKFIPMRGRKLHTGLRRLLDTSVEIYPREGTETTRMRGSPLYMMLKFIPVRGRKHHANGEFALILLVEIYPREGAEIQTKLDYL